MTYGTMRIQLIFISIIVIFLALVISALISMKLTKPITRITRAAKRMAEGDFTVNFKGEYSYAEMDALAETLDYAKEEIGKSDRAAKGSSRQCYARFKDAAYHDQGICVDDPGNFGK